MLIVRREDQDTGMMGRDPEKVTSEEASSTCFDEGHAGSRTVRKSKSWWK